MVPITRSCDCENLADFTRYYQGSWVGWHGSDSAHIQPCYVQGAVDAQHVHLRPLEKGKDNRFLVGNTFQTTWSGLRDHIDFGVPDIGMLPDGPTVLFGAYTTPRSPRKGYRSRDMKLNDFNSWDIRAKYKNNGGERYDWIWFAFNPEYVNLETAEEKLTKGEAVGVPLSRTLAIYSVPKFKYSLLAHKRWTVGHVVSPYLINLKREYADYEEDIENQTGAEVIVG